MEPLYKLPGSTGKTFQSYLLASGGGLVAASALASWIATQYVAAQLVFDARLGRPWWPWTPAQVTPALYTAITSAALALALLAFRRVRRGSPILFALALGAFALARGPVYSPFHFFAWFVRWHTYPGTAPLLRSAMHAWIYASLACALVWLSTLPIVASRRRGMADTHGSARWADLTDLKRSGLIADLPSRTVAGGRGLFLGAWSSGSRRYALYDDQPHHVFCFAPTRSGKGVGLVIPNLLNWSGSVIVHDIKAENWFKTAGWRQQAGSICIRFDPTYSHEGSGPRSCARYNPLLEIRDHPNDVRDAQNIADMLVDPNGDRVRDHWDRTAHALLTGLILYAHHTYRQSPQDCTLRQCASLLSQAASQAESSNPKEKGRNTVLEALRDAHHLGRGRSHPIIVEIMNAMIAKAPNEQSGVISTALSFLDLYRETLVADNTCTSDFRIEDLLHHEKPVSLYITVPPSDLSRTRALVRLMLNQICRRLTEALDHSGPKATGAGKRELLLMLDEFPALGKLPFFQDSLAYLAGYGIRAFLITQDLSQHQGIYGRDESITANCHSRIAFTPNKTETADLLSKMAGEMTVHQDKATRQHGGLGGALAGRVSVSHAESHRRLLTLDETLRLPDSVSLIFSGACRPIFGIKARYYEDPILLSRSSIPAPTQSDTIAKLPDGGGQLQPHQNAIPSTAPEDSRGESLEIARSPEALPAPGSVRAPQDPPLER